MATKVKRRSEGSGRPKAVIHNRRFWWCYPDGRMERIYLNERIKSALSQIKSMEVREGANS